MTDKPLKLAALSSFGLEAVVADELRELGFSDLYNENGRVHFPGNFADIAKCCINLRCADRVVLTFGSFEAHDFGELFEGVKSLPWEEIIPPDAVMHIVGKSVKSKLHSVPDCQAITKKAMIDAMRRKYRGREFNETGPLYKIEVSMLKDIATFTIDPCGAGLHKRGYRTSGGIAPLRETLAASIIRLSRWNGSRVLADPFCGSGTIAIEAAMAARKIAPGLNRNFSAEDWPQIPEKIWIAAREEARSNIIESDLEIFASDIDFYAVKNAEANAVAAGVDKNIAFQKKPVSEFSSKKKFGCVITNPPYGERLGDKESTEEVYRELAEKLPRLDTWSFFILSSHEEFGKVFGRMPDKNRKLYNGKIKCWLNMYHGPLPPRRKKDESEDT